MQSRPLKVNRVAWLALVSSQSCTIVSRASSMSLPRISAFSLRRRLTSISPFMIVSMPRPWTDSVNCDEKATRDERSEAKRD